MAKTEQLELSSQVEEQVNGSVELPAQEKIEDAEWCFQFFSNEPVVFGWSKEDMEATPLTIQINPVVNEGLVFNQNGMAFRIFARPISEETKKQRAEEDANQTKEA